MLSPTPQHRADNRVITQPRSCTKIEHIYRKRLEHSRIFYDRYIRSRGLHAPFLPFYRAAAMMSLSGAKLIIFLCIVSSLVIMINTAGPTLSNSRLAVPASPASSSDTSSDGSLPLPHSPVSSTDTDSPPSVYLPRLHQMPSSTRRHILHFQEPSMIQALVQERQAADFDIGPLRMHRVQLRPTYGLETEAFRYLQRPTTKISHVARPDRQSLPFRPKSWHSEVLMTPVPVSPEWYQMVHIPYTSQTSRKRPMLFFEYFTRARTEEEYIKLLGVGTVNEREDPQSFSERWQHSPRVDGLHDIRRATRWSELLRKP